MKSFFEFRFFILKGRSKHDRPCLVYADNEEVARQKVTARLTIDYGEDFELVDYRLRVFTDPQSANTQCRSGLRSALTKEDYHEFLIDRQSQQPEPCKTPRISTFDRECNAEYARASVSGELEMGVDSHNRKSNAGIRR